MSGKQTVASLAADIKAMQEEQSQVNQAMLASLQALTAQKVEAPPERKEASKPTEREAEANELFRVGSLAVELEFSQFTYRNMKTDFAGAGHSRRARHSGAQLQAH